MLPLRGASAFSLLLLSAPFSGCRGPAPDPGTREALHRLERIEKRVEALGSDVRRLADFLEAPPGGPGDQRVFVVDAGDAPVLGPEDAPVTIVEFADFECPFCAGVVPALQRLVSEYSGMVRWVFKHNPMPLHKRAILAHKAALAAGREGKFWQMHDRLFAGQDRLDRASLGEHARALGLDPDAFEKSLDSRESGEPLVRDRAQARELGVMGVPAFFINGRFVAGAQPYEMFQARVEEELAKVVRK